MNQYYKNFVKYRQFVHVFGGLSLSELFNLLVESEVDYSLDSSLNATIMMGYSGNGKSTYANNLLNERDNTIIISMDEVHNFLSDNGRRVVNSEDLIMLFGERLNIAFNNKQNIIIDGNFLNLFTRLSLIDTLHSYGYNVCGFDITALSDEIIENRIIDEVNRTYEKNNNGLSYSEYFVFVSKYIYDYREKERKNSFILEQEELGIVPYKLDEYVKFYNKDSVKKLVK